MVRSCPQRIQKMVLCDFEKLIQRFDSFDDNFYITFVISFLWILENLEEHDLIISSRMSSLNSDVRMLVHSLIIGNFEEFYQHA